VDADQDGYGTDVGTTTLAADGTCDTAQSESTTSDDCDDSLGSVYPGAAEIADDGIDQDCSGSDTITCIVDADQDGSDTITCIVDADQDGYGTDVGTTTLAADGTCDTAQSESTTSDDCDDSNSNIYPSGPPVRIAGPPDTYHSTIQIAYDTPETDKVLHTQATTLNEDLLFDNSSIMGIDAGYDCGYSTITGTTVVNGNVTINDGTITIQSGIFEIQ
jgi:hypothetical protein